MAGRTARDDARVRAPGGASRRTATFRAGRPEEGGQPKGGEHADPAGADQKAGGESGKAKDGTTERAGGTQPLPLFRPIPPSEPYPVEALGSLAEVVEAIRDRTQAPDAVCAQSVLGAASLVAQARADVELPTGEARPLSLFLVTVAQSGERKSAADDLASRRSPSTSGSWSRPTGPTGSPTSTRWPPGRRSRRTSSRTRRATRPRNSSSTRSPTSGRPPRPRSTPSS